MSKKIPNFPSPQSKDAVWFQGKRKYACIGWQHRADVLPCRNLTVKQGCKPSLPYNACTEQCARLQASVLLLYEAYNNKKGQRANGVHICRCTQKEETSMSRENEFCKKKREIIKINLQILLSYTKWSVSFSVRF